jgi:hypothetical protein
VGLHHGPHHSRRSYPHQPERRLVEDIAFRVLAADNQPNFRAISDFRRDPLKTMEGLFEEVLKIALEAGLKVGRMAVDGTKINANASKYKAMSYDRMKRKERISIRRTKICWRKRMRRRMRGLLSPTLRYTVAQESNPPGAEHSHAIAVNQQLRHHPRVVRRLATLLAAVHLIHRRKIELIDHAADDIRQMILRQPLPAGLAGSSKPHERIVGISSKWRSGRITRHSYKAQI